MRWLTKNYGKILKGFVGAICLGFLTFIILMLIQVSSHKTEYDEIIIEKIVWDDDYDSYDCWSIENGKECYYRVPCSKTTIRYETVDYNQYVLCREVDYYERNIFGTAIHYNDNLYILIGIGKENYETLFSHNK